LISNKDDDSFGSSDDDEEESVELSATMENILIGVDMEEHPEEFKGLLTLGSALANLPYSQTKLTKVASDDLLDFLKKTIDPKKEAAVDEEDVGQQ